MTKLRAVYTVSFILPEKLTGPCFYIHAVTGGCGAGGRPLPSVGKRAAEAQVFKLAAWLLLVHSQLAITH